MGETASVTLGLSTENHAFVRSFVRPGSGAAEGMPPKRPRPGTDRLCGYIHTYCNLQLPREICNVSLSLNADKTGGHEATNGEMRLLVPALPDKGQVPPAGGDVCWGD